MRPLCGFHHFQSWIPGIRLFLFFSVLLTDKFLWTIQPSSVVPIVYFWRGFLDPLFPLWMASFDFYLPGMELELLSSLFGSFSTASHYWGQYSVYSWSVPHMLWLASLSFLGCYKAPAMAFYVYFTMEANILINWKVNLFLKILISS